MYRRPVFDKILQRLTEKRSFIQVLMGPRQTGKTTGAHQIMQALDVPAHYATADEPALKSQTWIEQQWEAARLALSGNPSALLIIDEIQKIPGWSETVKRLWDEDSIAERNLAVVLLGSSTLLIQKGLTESLAGRFELVRIAHWSFQEMRDAFGFDLDTYLYFGGYPGAAGLISDRLRWSNYIKDALIETTTSRDILQMIRINKPALMRRLLDLGCAYSGRILSYQKMLGQLQDAGNTTTLAHYLKLLEGAGLLAGLSKYSERRIKTRASSPKLQVLNTALMSAQSAKSFQEAKADRQYWGTVIESAVGAHLTNSVQGTDIELFYWNSGNYEVDFILKRGTNLTAMEVKSGRIRSGLPGIERFSKQFDLKKKLLVGKTGLPIEALLLMPVEALVSD